jgi:hypothetical protein
MCHRQGARLGESQKRPGQSSFIGSQRSVSAPRASNERHGRQPVLAGGLPADACKRHLHGRGHGAAGLTMPLPIRDGWGDDMEWPLLRRSPAAAWSTWSWTTTLRCCCASPALWTAFKALHQACAEGTFATEHRRAPGHEVPGQSPAPAPSSAARGHAGGPAVRRRLGTCSDDVVALEARKAGQAAGRAPTVTATPDRRRTRRNCQIRGSPRSAIHPAPPPSTGPWRRPCPTTARSSDRAR